MQQRGTLITKIIIFAIILINSISINGTSVSKKIAGITAIGKAALGISQSPSTTIGWWPDIKTIQPAGVIGADIKKKNCKFRIGASTSEHQCSHQCNETICDWSRFCVHEQLKIPADISSMDWWNYYNTYLDTFQKELHGSIIRFSIEWSLVEPHEGEFDELVLDHYATLFCTIIKKGISPVVCLHHYTNPVWFTDRIQPKTDAAHGQFAYDDNIRYFVRYCTKLYNRLMSKLIAAIETGKITPTAIPPLYWATFNSPEGYAHKRGVELQCVPERKQLLTTKPYKKNCPNNLMMNILKNMMEAHVQVYKAIHAHHTNITAHNDALQELCKPQIGFLKNIHQLDPAPYDVGTHKKNRSLSWHIKTNMACAISNMIQDDPIYRFFTTGTFAINLYIPNIIDIAVHHENPSAPYTLDFIGLNYYSNGLMDGLKKIVEPRPQYATHNSNYRIYPAGLYRAIVELSHRMAQPVAKAQGGTYKAIPILVTENGITCDNDTIRAQFYHNNLFCIQRAINEGYLVDGYLVWTLADNYEWQHPEKATSKAMNVTSNRRIYGLCSVSNDGTTITPKYNAIAPFIDAAQSMQEITTKTTNA